MELKRLVPGRRVLLAGLVGLLVGLLSAGGLWWFFGRQATAQAATATTTTTRTVTASVDTIRKTIAATGTLTPAVQQDVSFVASGTVTDVPVSAGQAVTAGQALATVDTLTMQQTLADAKLTLAKAQATLVNDQAAQTTAQDALTTAQDAGDDTASAQAKVDTAAQQIDVDQTAITTARAAVATAQSALDSPTLTAPIDGIVAAVNVAVGQKVTGSTAGGTSTGSGGTTGSGNSTQSGSGGSTGSGSAGATGSTGGSGGTGATGGSTGSGNSGSGNSGSGNSGSAAAFVIVGTDSWKVDVTVDSAQIGLLSVGDQAQLTTSGSTEPLFGTISSVGLISTSTGSTATYPVEVAVTGSPTGLHDGESVTVTLIYQQFTDVLTVPSAAIHTENGQSVVYREDGAGQVATAVQKGETDGTTTEITSGLSEGDQVVVTVTTGGGSGTGRNGAGTTGQSQNGFGGTGGFGGGQGFPGGQPPAGFGGGGAPQAPGGG